ncbi:hypothetical protein [Paracoccus marinaquae]|uniref:Uncharacterized protein n=1 Tax=Paracoccus marinaquae TaxID=2841926 RepID=A0ABS6AH25_9RHOB|nr:hypothetical protein [Paracoccus marinaquae]MBU3029900.1 hypothetical protein [Paracoccus marinaquae]
MSDSKYVIVGSEVDQAEYYLHGDGSIDRDKGADGQPLNVEYIGKLMVELSKRGEKNVGEDELDRYQDHIKHALMVQDFSVQDGGAVLSDSDRDNILEGTDVRIEFETRDRCHNGVDKNSRILVVPSDQTLEITDALLQATGQAEGFRPPLSYELDKALMLASLKAEIVEIAREFAAKGVAGWTQQLQDALEAHVIDAVQQRSIFRDANGAPADDVKNEIMKSPLRAFYRSVGIYATNMCR